MFWMGWLLMAALGVLGAEEKVFTVHAGKEGEPITGNILDQEKKSDGLLDIDEDYEWSDSEITTMLWRLISQHEDIASLEALIKQDPRVVKVRAADGRGPLFWAYEYGHKEAVDLLESLGADKEAKDKFGMTAQELADSEWEEEEDDDDDEWEDEDEEEEEA
eukprot:gb/GEZN01014726.1/.p1 GENE.gb/GEZN01014726.1/~~gb/GEZN01014726.1/.p1  ORF type:complete len:162 (-),score=54.37 gb/GEZN01014726.1/:13-498(-)